MSGAEESSSLSAFCYNAGATLEDILLLEEDELIELSKNIVGNSVLEHARVIKQWRHRRMAVIVNKEIEEEMAYESVLRMHEPKEENDDEEDEEIAKKDLRASWETEYYLLYDKKSVDVEPIKKPSHPQQEAMGDDWQQYLKKQIQEQMAEQLAEEMERLKEEKQKANEVETFAVPRVISTVGSTTSDEESLWYDDATHHGQAVLATVTADMINIMEQGLSFLFGGSKPTKRK